MDSKGGYAPETASHVSNSQSGSPSSSSSSFSSSSSSDSIVDDSVKNLNLEVDDNSVVDDIRDTSRGAGGGSSDEGFASGEEDFEMNAGKTFVSKESSLASGSAFVDPREFPPLKVSRNDDDDDDENVVEGLKVGSLEEGESGKGEDSDNSNNKSLKMSWAEIVGDKGKEVFVGENEREGDKLDESDGNGEKVTTGGGDSVVEAAHVVGEDTKLDTGTSELKSDNLVESGHNGENVTAGGGEANMEAVLLGEDAKLDTGTSQLKSDKLDGRDANGENVTAGGGDSIVEAVHVDVSSPVSGVAFVGGDGFSVEDSVPLHNGYDKVSSDVQELVNKDTESEKNVETVTGVTAEPAEMECNGEETDVSGLKEVENLDINGPVIKENLDVMKVSIEKNESNEPLEKVLEPDTDEGIKQIEPVIETAVKTANDVSDVVTNHQADGVDGDEIRAIDMNAENSQTHVAHDMSDVKTELEDEVPGGHEVPESAKSAAVKNRGVELEAKNKENHLGGDNENEGPGTDGENEGMVFGSSEAARQFLEELERESGIGAHSGAESSHDHSQEIDGQIVTDSDEEVDTDEEGEGKELFDSAALAALLKAATGASSEGGTVTVTSQDGSRLFSVERPAGLGSSLRPVKPAARSNRPSLFTSSSLTSGGESENSLSEDEKKKLERLQQIRVKFLRLVHRLGHSPEESIAAQVLYRLALVAGRQTNQLFSLDGAKRTALQLEAERKEDLDFSLNILILGKSGVGKSATINSIFGEEKSPIHAFQPATNSVREITGVVDGIKIKVIDSPGLKSSGSEQGLNRRLLSSVKKLMKKCPPDIVLYVDRLDTQTRDLNDLPLLRSITSSLGSSIWRNAVVTLTHAASAPPDGPSGSPLSYEVFVAQRSHVVQQSIGQAVGDLRLMNPSLMNPVSLVENHPSCRKNREGQKVLPNGQTWRPQLLMLCYSMKILSEASSLSKPQDPFDHRKLFGFRSRSPPLPYLLSWLLQSRSHPKLAADQGGDSVDSDVDLADLSDSDDEEEDDEYDQLPPFKPLRKNQLAKLSKEQKKAYFEEYDYRVKLLQKKQWKEELRRMREIKKKGKVPTDEYGYNGEDADPENGAPAAVPVPLPDMVLPPSFDGDNPAYRYRFLEPTSQFLARPVLDTHGWDHDCGYDGVNIEHSLAVVNRFPATVTVQMTKDKKEFSIHLDSSVSAKHGENGSSMAGFDIQNVGKQLAYILRGETKFKNFKMNKTAAGVSVTFLGHNVATGLKLEDQIALGKRLMLVGSTGTVRSQGDSAYGANLEVRLREADYPIGQDQSSLGLSLVKWRGDLALGANLQSQFSVGRGSKIAVRAGLNNKMSGQISVRTSSSDQLQIALVALLPIAMSVYKSLRPGVSENYMY